MTTQPSPPDSRPANTSGFTNLTSMEVTPAATFCATIVDEWVRAGVTDAFLAPGSRSTPLALALAGDERLRVHVFHDERSASFAALGHARAEHTPAVVAATSGTASAHFHAAVIEADASAVPLIVCTTDRPPELWGVGAPQTIDQTKLYGATVRLSWQPGVPTDETRDSWRSMASRVVAEARGFSGRPGPVHANLSFRDPLVGEPGELPQGRPVGAPWHTAALAGTNGGRDGGDGPGSAVAPDVWRRLRGLDGVIVAGAGTSDPTGVLALARKLGWPVLADHRSGCRAESQAVVHAESLVRVEAFVSERRIDAVLRFGEPLAGKSVGQWLSGLDADIIVAAPLGRWLDPERVAALLVPEPGLARGLLNQIPSDYQPANEALAWRRADGLAQQAVNETAGAGTEIGIARHVVESIPSGGALVVASSMPVRDVEWFAPNRRSIHVYANRGANGIDGVTSTAIGVALTGAPTTLLIGDVAFLHDSAALVGLAKRRIDLRIVVIDNDGGGIFSFLPQASLLDSAVYEKLFGTPHGTDLVTLCQAHGIPAVSWSPGDPTPADVGVRVLVATTDRAANVRLHRDVDTAVARALAEDRH
jgi:2-succinyl-5-enolpyruvyl-6-hydroxy-3-cyclohexene-1-carboxylate synthase